MKRNIIEIDESRCNGCGQCIPNCHEGALQIIDGKARLISDLFCDGLGACIGHCPQNAIRVIERECAPYDEEKVMRENIIPHGEATIKAHLQHLSDHGETSLLRRAAAVLRASGLTMPPLKANEKNLAHCPGAAEKQSASPGATPSALEQWPIQLHLLNHSSALFDDADLLVAADCTAFTAGDFHPEFLRGKKLVVFCPKLDNAHDEYVTKLAGIFALHRIKSLTILRMEVPCCGGTVRLVREALQQAKSTLQPVEIIVPIPR